MSLQHSADPLTYLLAHYPESAQPTTTPVSLGNAGGLSGASLWRFDAPIGPLVVRCWPPGGADIGAIHRQLALLAGLGFVPIPLTARDGGTFQRIAAGGREKRIWEVTPWMPGAPDPTRPPRPARIRSAFASLAKVHRGLSIQANVAVPPGLLARLGEVEALIAGGLERIAEAVGRAATGPSTDLIRRWIAAARWGLPPLLATLRRATTTPVAVQPVIRDARAEHFLFENDRVSGLIDFGAMGIDAPAADLARLLTDMVGDSESGRSVALETYSSVRPIDPGEVGLIGVYEEANAWLGPARWVRWHVVERRTFDDPGASARGLERTVGRLFERIGGPGTLLKS